LEKFFDKLWDRERIRNDLGLQFLCWNHNTPDRKTFWKTSNVKKRLLKTLDKINDQLVNLLFKGEILIAICQNQEKTKSLSG